MKTKIYKICNEQNIRYDEMANRIFETYKSSVMPHGRNMFKTEPDMAMSKMCTHPSSNMYDHIGNVCCGVVKNIHVLI